MTPLLAVLVAIAANIIASIVAANTPPGESRVPSLVGAGFAIGAAGLCGVPVLIHGDITSAVLGPIALRADALPASLMLPMALAAGATAIGLPRRMAQPRVMASISALLAASLTALIADNLLVLVLAEIAGGAAVAWGLDPQHRAGRRTLLSSGLLAVSGLGIAAIQGQMLTSFEHGLHLNMVAVGLLSAALVMRLGAVPFHSGLTTTLRGEAVAGSVLLAAPLGGVAVLIRALQPALAAAHLSEAAIIATVGFAALAALLSIAAKDLGRSVAWVVAALHGLVIAGNINGAGGGALGGELLWAALILSETGFILAVAMVTRRLGKVDLRVWHGLHNAAPRLSLAFLLMALSIAGIPGTLEFIAEDVLLNTASSGGLVATVLTVVVLAAVGFNAIRLNFCVFFGPDLATGVNMDIRPRERFALLTLVAVVLSGGIAPGLLPLVAHAAGAAGGH